MLFKLALNNILKKKIDYLIYFITIVLIVTLMYSFLSLAFSEDIITVAENMSNFTSIIVFLSLLIAVISGFMISHTISFVLNRRKKEIALYMLMGMEEGKLYSIFVYENLFVGTLAFIVGCCFGSGFSMLLRRVVLSIFDLPNEVVLNLSGKAILLSTALYVISYTLALIKALHSMRKSTLIKLFYDNIRNEVRGSKKSVFIQMMIVIVIEIISLFFIRQGLSTDDNKAILYIFISVAVMLLGIIFFYKIFPDLFNLVSNKCKQWLYKDTNLFLNAQVVSKSKTAGKVMGIAAVLISSALVTMFVGFVMGTGYKTNIEAGYPYDVSVAIDTKIDSFDDVIDFVDRKVLVEDAFSFVLYESEGVDYDIISVSDYNRLRKQLGYEEINIKDDEYVLQCDMAYYLTKVKGGRWEKPEIKLGQNVLKWDSENIYTEPMEQYRMVGRDGSAIVVPDYIVKELDTNKSRLAIKLAGEAGQELKGELTRFIHKDWDMASEQRNEQRITITLSVKAWGIANSLCGFTTLSFCGLYLSIIFIIVAGILLAFEQLERITNNQRLYSILEKMGVDDKGRRKLILKELLVFFMMPLIFPIILFAIIVFAAQTLFSQYILSLTAIPICAGIALLIFMGIYIFYFFTTYVLYKRFVLLLP